MIKNIARNNRLMRLLYHTYTSKSYLPNWNNLLASDKEAWNAALNAEKTGPKVLIASAVGFQFQSMIIESMLAAALTLRGADVHILLCDSVLPSCFTSHITKCRNNGKYIKRSLTEEYCRYCFAPAYKMYNSLGLQIHRFSDFLEDEETQSAESLSSNLPLDEIDKYVLNGVSVGEHAMAGALRFYSKGSLNGEPGAETVLRHYLKSSVLTTQIMNKLLKSVNYDSAVFSHGIYVPHGLIGETCRKENVRVVNWVPSYRKSTFIFSHDNTYHHTMMTEPIDKWANITWNEGLDEQLLKYLKNRWTGKEDWIWFTHKDGEVDPVKVSEQLGIDNSKPCIGLLTNVAWDAQIHYPQNIFDNMPAWLFQTISYFKERQDLQLIIRIHPAEIKGAVPSRQKVMDEINKAFPDLPGNVFVIPPESSLNTYAAMSLCDSVIIYGTKMGTELTNMGIPVIVAGEAWIRNKGLTIDASSSEEYFRLLDGLPIGKPLDKDTIQKARKYAYHFFFRRMIPLEFVRPGKRSLYKIKLSKLQDLANGSSKGLDIICNGIMNGSDFIYPAEQDHAVSHTDRQ